MKRLRNEDITGQRFGRLIAVRLSGKDKHGAAIWSCICDCGSSTDVVKYALKRGTTKSCGCLAREEASRRGTRHGLSKCRVHSIWDGMLSRCLNQKAHGYERYGGRGITVCDRWLDFEEFFADMGHPMPNQTLDRIDNDKGYCKENCRWATRHEQNNNTKANRFLTAFGQTKTIAEWARDQGIKYQTLYRRLTWCGWSVEDALLTPVQKPPDRVATEIALSGD